ncbi:MAG: cyclic nucleotide-binding domain-containing protein [Hyphomonadaceae bacterium]|nr:cyclic nucleotide-binding domain-containing protein [Hyphomonadaceae bacterium]
MEFFQSLLDTFGVPRFELEHFTYLLLVLSMLMRRLVWLRAIAICSSIAQIAHAVLYESGNPVVIFWESTLTVVNLGQLALMWWENRQRRWSPEEQRFIDTFEPPLPPPAQAALLRTGYWHDAPEGSWLTVQGKPVDGLIFLSEGQVRIESGGKPVATCSAGDFLGEMTWQSGKPATGTAVAVGVVRYLRFERAALERAMKVRPVLRFALQTSFNRNLIEKLVRTNQALQSKPA